MAAVAHGIGVVFCEASSFFAAPHEVRTVESLSRWDVLFPTALALPIISCTDVLREYPVGAVNLNLTHFVLPSV